MRCAPNRSVTLMLVSVCCGLAVSGSVMAGQSVGMVKAEEPVATILGTLVREAEEALAGTA
jgi:enoyl-[acyl-carrier protein] reductase II